MLPLMLLCALQWRRKGRDVSERLLSERLLSEQLLSERRLSERRPLEPVWLMSSVECPVAPACARAFHATRPSAGHEQKRIRWLEHVARQICAALRVTGTWSGARRLLRGAGQRAQCDGALRAHGWARVRPVNVLTPCAAVPHLRGGNDHSTCALSGRCLCEREPRMSEKDAISEGKAPWASARARPSIAAATCVCSILDSHEKRRPI